MKTHPVTSKHVPIDWPPVYWRAAVILRALDAAQGPIAASDWFLDTQTLNLLRQENLVDYTPAGHYELTDKGREQIAKDKAERKDAKALVPHLPRLRKRRLSYANNPRDFPTIQWCREALARAELNGHAVTWNEDGQFSSPLLTAAYVKKYLSLNKGIGGPIA